MVAMNDGTGVKYFLTDHLGSVVAITDATGTLISQQRYLPFGGERTNLGSISQTDYGFTGQRDLDPGMGGLMDYKARFYSPYLNHFIQPDTLIPDPSNPQAWNRYGYVNNNPINFNDPTGHCFSGAVLDTLVCVGIGVFVIGAVWTVGYSNPDIKNVTNYIGQSLEQSLRRGSEKWEKDTRNMEYQMSLQFGDPNKTPKFNPKEFCKKSLKACIAGGIALLAVIAKIISDALSCSADGELCGNLQGAQLVTPTHTSTTPSVPPISNYEPLLPEFLRDPIFDPSKINNNTPSNTKPVSPIKTTRPIAIPF